MNRLAIPARLGAQKRSEGRYVNAYLATLTWTWRIQGSNVKSWKVRLKKLKMAFWSPLIIFPGLKFLFFNFRRCLNVIIFLEPDSSNAYNSFLCRSKFRQPVALNYASDYLGELQCLPHFLVSPFPPMIDKRRPEPSYLVSHYVFPRVFPP